MPRFRRIVLLLVCTALFGIVVASAVDIVPRWIAFRRMLGYAVLNDWRWRFTNNLVSDDDRYLRWGETFEEKLLRCVCYPRSVDVVHSGQLTGAQARDLRRIGPIEEFTFAVYVDDPTTVESVGNLP